ncbi:MAG: low molecular weight phosphotyrosine protein phosphatase [Clostridia bacterium]|nr:low molecular weight phosphotyrosine protein phosphatase [Clostridia bacterium]
MTRIMFVCHGNICRSPMAEFIFRRLAEERGLAHRFFAASSATSTEEILGGRGNPVYPPAREELLRHGIDPVGKRAVRLCAEDLSKYDLFVGLDSANIRNMHRMLGAAAAPKIYRLMDFTDTPGDVADPWYSDRFDIAYRDIERGCRALLSHLLEKECL